MDCERTQAAILASFDGDRTASAGGVEEHLAACHSCARFAAVQRAIDARLAAGVLSPSMDSDFRRSLRARMARERAGARSDALPDIVHFASWGTATLLSVLVLPLDASVVLAGGATATLLAYVALTVARTALEDAEAGALTRRG
jgi:predicted anti-sigma-YlaC factor YlaD